MRSCLLLAKPKEMGQIEQGLLSKKFKIQHKQLIKERFDSISK